MNKLIFDPLEEFRDKFKPLHKQNVSTFFADLKTKANVNEEDNKLTVKEIKVLETKIANEEKLLSKIRTYKSLTIFGIVASLVAAIIFGFSIYNRSATSSGKLLVPLLLLFLFLGLFSLFIFVLQKKLKPRIKNSETIIANLMEQKEALINKAWLQVAPLLDLFDATMAPQLLEKTIPLLTMDPLFDAKRFDYLSRKYKLRKTGPDNESIEFVQSGEIQGNPFILSRYLRMDMGTKRYSASRTYSYTRTIYVNGKPQIRTYSETLTANIDKPYPYYSNDTLIIYGNEAAERLSFSRRPVVNIAWTEKDITNIIKKEEKTLKQLTAEALKKGKQFTPLGNTKFEALFQAYDRDNEQQFRLLFTALGQSEIMDLILDKKEGFGDNFEFYKHENLNFIRSYHSQKFDYTAHPSLYAHYDLDVISERFNNYNNNYLRYFYFNIAPILAIPLYQQHKPHEFIYEKEYKSHLSFYEHESTANQFDISELEHEESVTKNILKTKLVAKGSDFDIVNITAYGYRKEQRYENVRVTGQSGSHVISVPWEEFIPVSKTTPATIKVAPQEQEKVYRNNDALNKLNEYLTKVTGGKMPIKGRRVFAFLLASSFSEADNNKLNDTITEFNKK